MPDAIRTDRLTKRYGDRTVVRDLTLTVPSGAVFGFLGPNGAGKTTTIAMLLGLVRPTSGSAELLGVPIGGDMTAVLARVGAMVEAPAFYPYLSGRDNLHALALASAVDPRQVALVLAEVDLTERANDRFRTYSQGMRQRLAIAAALLHNPELVILDEPTNGLDPAGQQEIRALVRGLAAAGRTVLLCSHQLAEVEELCAQVAILRRGELVVAGPVATLLRATSVLVRVDGDPAAALTLLRATPWISAVQITPDGGLLIDAPATRAAEINTLLVRADIAVHELHPQRQRLEDVFLELTR
jgi:ABC-2 type transport system ATP-binding protein